MADELTETQQSQWDEMVTQIARRGVSDPRILDALRTVPRQQFVPDADKNNAFGDFPLPIGEAQTISQPLMVGLMTQLLALTGRERVLEIGTGSGYQTAILARLAAQVVTVERHPSLSREARERLATLGYENVVCVEGDGTEGYPPQAPYDAILVTAGAPQEVPPPLTAQLAPGGCLVIPLGSPDAQVLTLIHKLPDGSLKYTAHGDCLFVPLIGRHGWAGGAPEE